MTFVSSRKYKNIEEWFYEDEIFKDWDGHPNLFTQDPQKGGRCRVIFTRGWWNTSNTAFSGSNDDGFDFPLQGSGWTNQMFQKNSPS